MEKKEKEKLENGTTTHNRPVYASSLERLGVQSARSLRSHASFTQIASPRNPTGCFIVGWQLRKQPER